MVSDIVGSEKLRKSLPYGSIKEMARAFDASDAWISKVVAGKQNGKQEILQCAAEIAALHSENKIKLTEILKNYGRTN